MKSTRYSCQILIKLEFSRRDFLKSSNIIFHENSTSGIEVVSHRPSDRLNEANGPFKQFCERA